MVIWNGNLVVSLTGSRPLRPMCLMRPCDETEGGIEQIMLPPGVWVRGCPAPHPHPFAAAVMALALRAIMMLHGQRPHTPVRHRHALTDHSEPLTRVCCFQKMRAKVARTDQMHIDFAFFLSNCTLSLAPHFQALSHPMSTPALTISLQDMGVGSTPTTATTTHTPTC